MVEKNPKNPGEITLAAPWVAGTRALPDLYAKKAKNEKITVPMNAYGDEEAKEGSNYAGILIFSDKEKEPRSYLNARLKNPMLAGEHYCVKFHVSLADMSKYATNNIAALISKDSVASDIDLVLKHQPQIINSTNRIFEKQWSWEPICRIYIAEGGEEYITIGNFAPQDIIQKKAVKRSQGYTAAQTRDSYFYIDDVSVTPNATPENCKCEPGKFAFANLNKEQSQFTTSQEDIPDKVFISTTGEVHGSGKTAGIHEDLNIHFESGKSVLLPAETALLDEAASYLTANPDVTVKLIGHKDASEKVMTVLSGARLNQVMKYLVSKGVSDKIIITEDVKETQPLTQGVAEKHGNMVVEVKFSRPAP